MDLVKGGVGLIISGHSYILPDGQASSHQLGIHNDSLIPGLKNLVNKVHNGGGKIVAQISHGGAYSNPAFTGVEPMGPSAIPESKGKIAPFGGCRSMSQGDINRVVNGFRDAAVRVKNAGFDGVQFHGAHSFLMSEFLSPFYNHRTDKYGGRVENRTRIIVEAYDRVREAVGDNYPVMIKMNATDYLDDGISSSDALEAAKIFEDAGFDAIELSGGTLWGFFVLGEVNRSFCKNVEEEAYYRDFAERLKEDIKVPVVLTGGIKSFEVSKDVIESGVSDYVGFCRPLIREPDMINRWKAGDTIKSGCISDNACLLRGPGKDLQCFHVPKKIESIILSSHPHNARASSLN